MNGGAGDETRPRAESGISAAKAISGAIGGMFGHSSDIHEAIRQLFDLSPDYQLVSDVDTQLKKKGKLALIPGHLYIFNKCLGFHSPKVPAIVIQYSQIEKVSKNEKMLIMNKHNIKVKLADGTTYKFKRMKNRDETIGIIQKLVQGMKNGGSSDLGSSISPGQADSTITLDSALKQNEENEDDSEESGEEDKNGAA